MKQITYVLNLSEGFRPTRKYCSLDFEAFKFHGGECHIKLGKVPYDAEKVVITHRIQNSDDLMLVLFAKDALERKGVKNFELVIPYLPYARQDRQCAMGESFTLKVFCNLINDQNFEKVWILDAHSDVTPALLNNSVNVPNNEYVKLTILDIHRKLGDVSDLVLVSPDAGANKKCNKLFSDLSMFQRLVKCDKVRDLETGKLSGFEVFANDLNGAPCLIVDDICDGGGTFLGIADELKKKNAGEVYLFVSHGIFSKGLETLSEVFSGIYSTNSFRTIEPTLTYKQFNFNINN